VVVFDGGVCAMWLMVCVLCSVIDNNTGSKVEGLLDFNLTAEAGGREVLALA